MDHSIRHMTGMDRHRYFVIAVLLMLGGGLVASAADKADFFEKRVRPVLVAHCYDCHSAESKKLKAHLRVDSRSGLLTGGDSGAAIVPGKPDLSRMIKAVEYHDLDLQMPPRKRLNKGQVADLRQWVLDGAVWPGGGAVGETAKRGGFDLAKRKAEFWAWQPIKEPSIPFKLNSDWPRDHLDYFILAKLADNGLKPMKDANRVTLIRRASFDLIGLPPTPEEVEAFVNDKSAEAFANVVDRLLESDHFGERWARHWLDMVRYSETLGHEFDYTIHNAWRYRDYVIRAFNADVPYDQFMKEHVAGDLLRNPRRNQDLGINESVIGTSFYWFGQQKHSPVDIRQETADTIDNQIDVLTKTFMGMTVSCARCHDHKFDAISTKDYYALFGVLGSSRYAQRAIDEDAAVGRQLFQLVQLHQDISTSLKQSVSPELKRAKRYMTAAVEVVKIAKANPPESGEILFEDFESGNFDGWETTGNAFSSGPRTQQTIGGHQGDVRATGRFFVNSHNITRDGRTISSDGHTGTLTSPEFVISRPYIRFLIGGGYHKRKTCINLLVDGKVVDSKVGPANNLMRPEIFDVSAYIGKRGRIQAVDQVRGGWGNIGLDHIVFSSSNDGVAGPMLPSTPQLEKYARDNRLDLEVLRKWVLSLADLKELSQSVDASVEEGVFADFATNDRKEWFREGVAFLRDQRTGKPALSFRDGKVTFQEPGWVSSARLAKKFQGAFRSPTFAVDMDYIHLLVAGEGSRVNAVVDNFTIIKNPIWGGLKGEIKKAQPHWVTLDLRMAQGRRAWLELLDQSNGDPAGKGSYPSDGWFAVRKVIFSDDRRTPKVSTRHRLAGAVDALDADRIDVLAAEIATVVSELQTGGDVDVHLLNWLSSHDLLFESNEFTANLAKVREIAADIPSVRRVPSMVEGKAHNERVFIRGGHRNLGDEVPRRFLEAIQGSQEGFRTPLSGRLELANWLVDERNPLPARVAVNKVWHHLFGRGIVGSVADFGVLGERPSHPELLDHLAGWYRENGWSTKALIRRVMLSRTYQMASATADAVAEGTDPNNTLLHRANVKRLEGEVLRDAILMITGTFDDKMYGDPVPVYLTSFMEGRGRPRSGPLDGGGRRSIYVAVRRNFLSPLMLAFDTPPPATTVGRRTKSNVPAQALIMMNDPFVVEQSQKWAEKLNADFADDRLLIGGMYHSVFGRAARSEEMRASSSFLKRQTESQGGSREKAVADLAHVLFNVKEFMFLN